MLHLFTHEELETEDGLSLALYHYTPKNFDPIEKPTLVLLNGLGGNLVTWTHLIHAFKDKYRIVSWDYRGLYASALRAEAHERFRQGTLSVDFPHHVLDARRVLDHLEVEKAIFVGWSMGVQVNFALAKTEERRMKALVQVCGGPGKLTQTTVLGQWGLSVIPFAMESFRLLNARFGALGRPYLSSKKAIAMAKSIGLLGHDADEALARSVVKSYLEQDFEVYNRILLSLGLHDASEILPTLRVPTLLVGGKRDLMTPSSVFYQMADSLPLSKALMFEKGTHYVPIEFPDELNHHLEAFFTEIEEGSFS